MKKWLKVIIVYLLIASSTIPMGTAMGAGIRDYVINRQFMLNPDFRLSSQDMYNNNSTEGLIDEGDRFYFDGQRRSDHTRTKLTLTPHRGDNRFTLHNFEFAGSSDLIYQPKFNVVVSATKVDQTKITRSVEAVWDGRTGQLIVKEAARTINQQIPLIPENGQWKVDLNTLFVRFNEFTDIVTVDITVDNYKSTGRLYANSISLSALYMKQEALNLQNISLNSEATNYRFAHDRYMYENIIVPYETSSIQVTPTGIGELTVNGQPVVSGQPSPPISLEVWIEKVIEVRVDGEKTYYLKVKRNLPKVAKPIFSIKSGAVPFSTNVEIISPQGGEIYYSVNDGPLTGYVGGVVINKKTTLKAFVKKQGFLQSDEAIAIYTQATSDHLTSLSFEQETTGFVFEPTTYLYNNIIVENHVDYVQLIPSGQGTIQVDGYDVKSGQASQRIALLPASPKTIQVVVTEKGKLAKTYQLIVTRKQAKQQAPQFSIPSGEVVFGSSVTVTSAEADFIYYTTDGSEPTNENAIKATVPAQIIIDKEMTIRAIAVKENAIPSSEATVSYTQATSSYLTNIMLSGQHEGYHYKEEVFDYNDVTVSPDVAQIKVTPVGQGTITVNGSAVVSGASSAAITLQAGQKTPIKVVVTEVGKRSRTYTIYVTRQKSNDASLKQLGVTAGTLREPFKSEALAYSINVGNEQSMVTLLPVADSRATVEMWLDSQVVKNPIALKVGTNVVRIDVLAEDGVSKRTYTVTVYRERSTVSEPVTPVNPNPIPTPPQLTPTTRIARFITEGNERLATVDVQRNERNGDTVLVSKSVINDALSKLGTKREMTLFVDDPLIDSATEVLVTLKKETLQRLKEENVDFALELKGIRVAVNTDEDNDIYYRFTKEERDVFTARIRATKEWQQWSKWNVLSVVGELLTVETNSKQAMSKIRLPLPKGYRLDEDPKRLAIFNITSTNEGYIVQGKVNREGKYDAELTKLGTFTFIHVDNEAPSIITTAKKTIVVKSGERLVADYSYSDSDGDLEGETIIKWYRYNKATSTVTFVGKGRAYTVTAADEGNELYVTLQPISLTGKQEGQEVEGAVRYSVSEGCGKQRNATGCLTAKEAVTVYRFVAGKLVKIKQLEAGQQVAAYGYIPALYRVSNRSGKDIVYVERNEAIRYETPKKALLSLNRQGKLVRWKGTVLAPQQIGQLTVLQRTKLIALNGTTKVEKQLLKQGTVYRVYGYTPRLYDIGNGNYIIVQSNVEWRSTK